ncbi:hypothetical protein THTE_1100 [Thermogutta terrifontis]|jgi:hypothetical protein|uniref:Magnesium transporter MgtE intracellular domain-containing protein n=1 Tax=Thermogutta terrifontis TaxID=1331910 RepID=A0A286RCL0_9BACT|nr:hypothetical protein [Thermogutta terrifontis]ASV73702.1 hypothetical protein THTE_1100 [Thermogutta terrifontis]
MGRVLEGLLSAALYFFAAMAIGALCIAGHLWFAWGLTPAKVRRGLAVMRGEQQTAESSSLKIQEKSEPQEEPSYEAILQQRTLEYRDIELKNKMLMSYKDEIENIRQQVDYKEKIIAEKEKKLETLIAQTRQEAEDAGLETVRRTLESLRPAQAKELISEMLNRNELDDVVRLLQGMNDSKRARIIGEFRTPQEAEQIAEVLRRLREGGVIGESMATPNRLPAVAGTAPAGTQ